MQRKVTRHTFDGRSHINKAQDKKNNHIDRKMFFSDDDLLCNVRYLLVSYCTRDCFDFTAHHKR